MVDYSEYRTPPSPEGEVSIGARGNSQYALVPHPSLSRRGGIDLEDMTRELNRKYRTPPSPEGEVSILRKWGVSSLVSSWLYPQDIAISWQRRYNA